MARDNRFKLVLRNEGKGPNELYDERSDPREKTNVYNDPRYVTTRDGVDERTCVVADEVLVLGERLCGTSIMVDDLADRFR